MAWGTAPHVEDPGNMSPFPVIQHYCLLKQETGSGASPTLANPSGREMELGHWRDIGGGEEMVGTEKRRKDQVKKLMH